MQRIVLGIDGGGTKTVACLAQLSSAAEMTVLGRGQAASANLRAVGREEALANLESAIDAAWNDSEVSRRPVDCAILALAGAALPDVQDSVVAWSQASNLARKLRIVHDAMAVLEAGTPTGRGVALVAGTGSVAMGKDDESNVVAAGGWGYWFGDEGSAYSLGQEALRAITRVDDGRGPATVLAKTIFERLDITDPRMMLSVLANSGDVRRAIAELADLVSSAAEQQDLVACQIVVQAGRELAKLVKCVVDKLRFENDIPLALAGGVLCKSGVVRENLLRCLRDEQITPSTLNLVEDPVTGCLKLARIEIESVG